VPFALSVSFVPTRSIRVPPGPRDDHRRLVEVEERHRTLRVIDVT
jgi:hypothetical protein